MVYSATKISMQSVAKLPWMIMGRKNGPIRKKLTFTRKQLCTK
jgi:hypothetical protein